MSDVIVAVVFGVFIIAGAAFGIKSNRREKLVINLIHQILEENPSRVFPAGVLANMVNQRLPHGAITVTTEYINDLAARRGLAGEPWIRCIDPSGTTMDYSAQLAVARVREDSHQASAAPFPRAA